MMNKRTKELAAEAWTFTIKQYDVPKPQIVRFQEKFTELVAKECAAVVRQTLIPSHDGIPSTVALEIAAKNIERLFDVKE